MSFAPFSDFPDDARLWLFAFTEALDLNQVTRLAQGFEAFKPHWKTHGTLIDSEWMLVEDQILAVVERTMGPSPSGCSIDTMLRHVQKMAQALEVGLADANQVPARLGGRLQLFPKADVPHLIESGRLTALTPVYDLGLLELGQLRAGKLTRPLEQTWMGRKYRDLLQEAPTAH